MTSEKKMIEGYPYIRYTKTTYPPTEMVERTYEFHEFMNQRRTVREFSDKPVPREVIENLLKSASTAPSGAHKQPWTFCAVSNPHIKSEIKKAAEKEEYESYHGRMNEEWVEDLRPLGTDWHKPFLEIAPYLIIVFKKSFNLSDTGEKSQNYYVNESVGLACGFLLTAIHQAGLVALTHTPSPMNFLTQILDRPKNEKPFLLIPVGYPADEIYVPDIKRREVNEISVFYD